MVHTPSLWISEGITDYYAAVALARTGIFSPQDYLDHMGRVITALEQSPGPQGTQHRRHQLGHVVWRGAADSEPAPIPPISSTRTILTMTAEM